MPRPCILAAALLLLGGSVLAAEGRKKGEPVFLEVEKNRPVTKVVNILKDMVGQMESEAKEDEDVYQKMECWCATNIDEKTQAIKDSERTINDLPAVIEETTANSAGLNTDIANLGKEVAKNEEALDTATSLRNKQLAEFNAEEKEMMQTLTSVKSAVAALSKHHESFLQTSTTVREMEVAKMTASMQLVLHKHARMLAEKFTPNQLKLVASFVQGGHKQPQSGEIFGILKAMNEEFERNIANAQKDEKENAGDYEELETAKTQEIAAGQELADTKTNELATNDEKNAQAKQDLELAKNTLAADKKALAEIQETCRNADQEYEERVKARQLEISAVSKALAFLNSDEAHALFSKSLSLVQTNSKSQERRARASKILASAAKRSQDPRLAVLAVQAGPSGMGALGKTLQDMVDNLLRDNEDDIKLKDYCVAEFSSNGRDTTSKNRDKGDEEVTIADLGSAIETATQEIAVLKDALAETALQLKHAGENREKANAEFHQAVTDQRATQKLLAAALDILKGFYDKAALMQVSADSLDEQPKFKSFEKNKKSGGVMGMMQEIIDDAKALEDELTYGEEKQQKEHEAFVVTSNDSLEAMKKDLTAKTATKAKSEGDKVEHETELEGIEGELEYLVSAESDLHKQCDFTLKNFDARQAARGDEVGALREAIGIFAGSK